MPAPVRSRQWIWFFVVLGLFGLAAMVIPVIVNLQRQLKPEELAENRRLWQERGPQDYDLDYSITTPNSRDTYRVQVRRGRVIFAEPDNRPLAIKQSYYGMPALFDYLEEFLEQDRQPGRPRSYNRADFDPEDGHLLRYVRRVMGTRDQLEINVKLTPAVDAR